MFVYYFEFLTQLSCLSFDQIYIANQCMRKKEKVSRKRKESRLCTRGGDKIKEKKIFDLKMQNHKIYGKEKRKKNNTKINDNKTFTISTRFSCS